MNQFELNRIGQKLFGNRWKAPLARKLGIRRETVSRWAAGKLPVSNVITNMLYLLERQGSMHYQERRFKCLSETKQIENAQLIHGDSLNISQVLGQVDVILTDPVWPKAIPGLAGSSDPFSLLHKTLHHLVPKLNPEGRIIIQLRCDSDPRILSAVPAQFPFLRVVWLPYAVPSRQGRLLISGDVAYIFGKPPSSRPGNRVMPGQPHSDFCPPAVPDKIKVNHPCPRHLTHVEWLIEKFTNPSDIILDPFMGSGTSGVAALNRGREFIGVEIERNYWLEAQQRITQECMINFD